MLPLLQIKWILTVLTSWWHKLPMSASKTYTLSDGHPLFKAFLFHKFKASKMISKCLGVSVAELPVFHRGCVLVFKSTATGSSPGCSQIPTHSELGASHVLTTQLHRKISSWVFLSYNEIKTNKRSLNNWFFLHVSTSCINILLPISQMCWVTCVTQSRKGKVWHSLSMEHVCAVPSLSSSPKSTYVSPKL